MKTKLLTKTDTLAFACQDPDTVNVAKGEKVVVADALSKNVCSIAQFVDCP